MPRCATSTPPGSRASSAAAASLPPTSTTCSRKLFSAFGLSGKNATAPRPSPTSTASLATSPTNNSAPTPGASSPGDPVLLEQIPTTAAQPEDERHDIIARAVDRLPERQRAVIHLIHYQALTHAEAAQRLDLTSESVRITEYRALQKLRAWCNPAAAAPEDEKK